MKIESYTKNISSSFDVFSKAIQNESPVTIHSIHVVGSALTPDFIKGQSDINSIVVTEKIQLEFLDFIVDLGKKYSKHGIAAPLLMTPNYIETSLDVFPIEFLNFRAIHHTVFGSDLFRDLIIEPTHLRLQCEREIKSKLLWLHQSYIESLGDEEQLLQRLTASITGFIPLFRAILFLAGHEPVLSAHDTATVMETEIGQGTGIFKKILQLKNSTETEKTAPLDQLSDCFATYYAASQHLADYVEKLAD